MTLDGPAASSAVLTSHGGAVKSLVLAGREVPPRARRGRTSQIDLVRVDEGPAVPARARRLAGARRRRRTSPATPARARPCGSSSRDARRRSSFEGRVGSVDVRKTFRLTGKPFELALDVEVTGAARGGRGGAPLPRPTRRRTPRRAGCSPGRRSTSCARSAARATRPSGSTSAARTRGRSSPGAVALGRASTRATSSPRRSRRSRSAPASSRAAPEKGTGLAALCVPVEGGARRMSLTVYAGPKDLDTLRGYGRGLRHRHRLRRDGAPVRVLRAHPPLRDALVREDRRATGASRSSCSRCS